MKEIKLPMKKSFPEFMSLCEGVRTKVNKTYDTDVMGRSQIRKEREGGRVGVDRRKTEPEKRRMKAVGGGKMAPAKGYKDRKDISSQKKRSEKEQQPTQERGSARLDPREAQRKAARERRAAKSGTKTPTASQLLSKGNKAKTDPNNPKYKPDPRYKPAKASGMTRAERMKVVRKGETKLRNIMKDTAIAKYKKKTGQDPDKKAKMKIMGRVHQQMRT